MIKLIVNYFVDDIEDTKNLHVRQMYGNVLSMFGIILNLMLCASKFIVGMMVGSISISADAFNNLSDAGSSLISFISFYLSSKPADEKHPYGHARYEYIASMIVAFLIILLGVEVFQTGLNKVFHPQIQSFSHISMIVLIISMLVKVCMYVINRHYGNILQSKVMLATATDSISDVMATLAIFISMILSSILHFDLDGYMGMIVACIIIWNGLQIVRSSLDDILGKAPNEAFVKQLEAKILSYEDVQGLHDIVVHEYGVNRIFASVHVEVDYRMNVLQSHDMIDNIERDVKKELGVELVVHMDPIVLDDPLTNTLKKKVENIIQTLDQSLSLHDFRVVPGPTHTNLIFDVVVPFHVRLSDQEIIQEIEVHLQNEDVKYHLVVTFDHPYTIHTEK